MAKETSTKITASLQDKLNVASACIDTCLEEGTGLGKFARTTISDYCISTNALPDLNRFPMLVFKGAMGTGKSSAQKAVGKFARNPKLISLRGRTLPTVRDDLAECHEGTAIIEEGDSSWKQADSESLLSDRCQRDTAEAAIKMPSGDGSWKTDYKKYFGATVIHRRMPFGDAALAGRSIIIRFLRNTGKTYPGANWAPDETLVKVAHEYMRGVDLRLPSVKPLEGVDARIMDTYSPILGVAQLLEDSPFLEYLKSQLQTATLSLREAQSSEPEPLILNALMECLGRDKKGGLDFLRRVPFSDISDKVERAEHAYLKPHQIGSILRDLNFKVVKSHGVSKVEVTPAGLIAACEQFGIEDEALSGLKAEMLTG
jgi:hypothetical protein